jgi:hypothetical protein
MFFDAGMNLWLVNRASVFPAALYLQYQCGNQGKAPFFTNAPFSSSFMRKNKTAALIEDHFLHLIINK